MAVYFLMIALYPLRKKKPSVDYLFSFATLFQGVFAVAVLKLLQAELTARLITFSIHCTRFLRRPFIIYLLDFLTEIPGFYGMRCISRITRIS